MVVTRRQSAGPVLPATSRTNSSTGMSRSSKGKDKGSPLKDSGVVPGYVAPNGAPQKLPPVGPRTSEDIIFDDDSPPAPAPKKSSTKTKSRMKGRKPPKPKKHPPPKGVGLIDMIARVFLLWLTIYTLSVCPEDTELRSPVCRGLTEYRRIILEPYILPPIRRALDHPAIAPHIQRVQPIYQHVVQASAPLLRRGKREWRSKVTPRMQVVQQRIRPYFLRAQQQFDATVGPYVQRVRNTAMRYKVHPGPYVLTAIVKSQRRWEATKPFLIPVWRKTNQIVMVYFVAPLAHARRQLVDPHITKIWEAVVEPGKVRTTSVAQPADTTEASPTYKSPITSISTTVTFAKDLHQTASVANDPSASEVPESSGVVSNSISEHATASTSVPQQNGTAAVSETSSTNKTASDEHSSVSTMPKSQTTLVPEQAKIAVSPASSESVSHTDVEDADVEDLEQFLRQLDVRPSPKVEQPPEPEPEPEETWHEETEEERQERLRKVAEERAEIESRHTRWEEELEEYGKAQHEVVRATLKSLRDAACEEARAPDGPVRKPIEELTQEAEKSLRSLKAYAKKLAGENSSEQEKIKAWEMVVEKVDQKFGGRLDSTANIVKEWWDMKIEEETRQVHDIGEQVKRRSEKAQNDLGFDYTWLHGVTYDDWQRFHKLMYTGYNFADYYVAMQNGSAPNAPADPVTDIMEAIQEEVDDMILGFESNLSRTRKAALESFSGRKDDDTVPRDTSAGDESGAPVTAGTPSVPEVSILPIVSSDVRDKENVPPVILSRGAEEVRSAMSRAEEARVKHSEL